MNRWFSIRLVIAALAFGSGVGGAVDSAFPPGVPSGVGWWVCGVVIAGVAFIAFCGIGGGYQTEGVSAGWIKPSWYQNPFRSRSQPLQSFHLVAVSAMAEGVGGVLRELLSKQYERAPLAGIFLAVGLGAWVALRVAVMMFHPRDVSTNSKRDAGHDSK